MKRILSLIILITLLAIALILIGCGNKVFLCANGETAMDPSECELLQQKQEKIVENSPAKPQEIVVPTPSSGTIPEDIQKVLNGNQKVKSLSVNMKVDDKIHHMLIKGNKVKLYLRETGLKLTQDEFDTIIFDTDSKTAIGYCEIVKSCTTTGEKRVVDFDTYYIETPLDWVAKIRSAEFKETARIQDRNVIKIIANGEDMYALESFYGVPFEIETSNDHIYIDNVIFNKVGDEIGFQKR